MAKKVGFVYSHHIPPKVIILHMLPGCPCCSLLRALGLGWLRFPQRPETFISVKMGFQEVKW